MQDWASGARDHADGKVIEPPDFTQHDATLAGAKDIRRILYGNIPMPDFPEEVTVTPELELAAKRSYLQHLVDHLATLDLGYDNFMFYPEDEPGLTGSIDGYMRKATANKVVDPRVVNFANPWGSVDIEKTNRMATVTDVWQPGMATVDVLGQPYIDAMRAGGKPIWMYSVVGSVRIMRPLGFYRAQPWVVFWGIEGGGWWTYHSADLWATKPAREPEFGGVAADGCDLVTSRRWEAMRDGIEDFNILCLLRDAAEEKADDVARKLLDEAVGYVFNRSYTGLPCEAKEYELDFVKLTRYRHEIRQTIERLTR